ncbi:MAG: hypothetical protein LBG74_06840 [Spirochaetaceae bacterium]|nr:hypothetical protein [Spirochaetaceae bacterium]
MNEKQFVNEMIAAAFFQRRKNHNLNDWLISPQEKWREDSGVLFNEAKLEKRIYNEKEYIFLKDYFINAVRQLWMIQGGNYAEPFPHESKIPYPVPQDLLQVVTPIDLKKFLTHPPESNFPLLRLAIGDNGSIITLASYLRTKLLEGALIRIRAFIVMPQNLDYIREGIKRLMPDSESYREAALNMLRKETLYAARALEESDNKTYRFWICLRKVIHNYPGASGVPVSKVVSFLQAADVIELFNEYYHERFANESGENSLIGQIESQMAKPPYFFTAAVIAKFTDKHGKPFSDIMPQNDLLSILQKRSSPQVQDKLPEMLIFSNPEKERFYVIKKCLFTAFLFRMNKARQPVIEAVRREWAEDFAEYHRTAAMKNDFEFEVFIAGKLRLVDSFLSTIYLDNRLPMLKKELAATNKLPGIVESLFDGYTIEPLHKIFKLERKALLRVITADLPFWHRLPFVVAIIRLLRGIHD